MGFQKNAKAFLAALLGSLSGAERFLAASSYCASGVDGQQIKFKDVYDK